MIPPLKTQAIAVLLCTISGATWAWAGDGLFDPKALPANQWVKLSGKVAPGYMHSAMVYVPSRGQLLHWGAVGTVRAAPRNDVRAFDTARGDWVSDYPPAEKLPPLRGQKGKGVYYAGSGAMLAEPVSTPAPSMIVDGVCYDSRRDQVIYTMKGLMAAYDPKTRTWRDMKARTVIDGQEYPGAPPAYGVGACYDPVNDEIVLFSHWSGARDPKNTRMRPITGQVSAHLGTFVYSFRQNAWRQVSDRFGGEQVKAARKTVIELMGRTSRALDEAFVLRRRPDAGRSDRVGKALAAVAADLEKAALPGAASAACAKAIQPLKSAAHAADAGEMTRVIQSGGDALRALEAVLDGPLRVEPPARCGSPLIYDPANKVIVMFGGHDGLVRTDLKRHGRNPTPPGLNDTWLYDVETRRWREADCPNRPPPTRLPRMLYDPASGLVLLVTRNRVGSPGKGHRVTIWAFDAAKGEWTRRHEQPWTEKVAYWYTVGLDAKHRLLVLTQVDVHTWPQCVKGQETYVLRLDTDRMAASPAPAWTPPPPIRPQRVPPDDPAWLAGLKSLPANTWVHARPPRDADTRDWGVAACDPVRGWLVYFGGGHSTYQVNDVAIYSPGANRWAYAAGDHNDWVPPVGWGGTAMGLRGGKHAHHQRNAYVAVNGRMYVSMGSESRRWGAASAKRPGPRYAWFYDIDRGGMWRQQEVAEVARGPKVPGAYGVAHLATPDGRVLGFGGTLEPYDGRFFNDEVYFNCYDIYKNRLTIRKAPGPAPDSVLECRPFCFLPERNQVFFYEYRGSKDQAARQRTWVYDIETNRFTNLSPRRHPPGRPGTVEYLARQSAVFAVVGRGEQWVYSFEHNTWAPLALRSDGKIGFAGPYAQTVYSAKYGVLINTGAASRGLAVMRPDVSKLNWE